MARDLHGFPGAVHQGSVRMAAFHDIARAVFAATALRGDAEVNLYVLKALAFTRVLVNFFVRYAAADTNNHGVGP